MRKLIVSTIVSLDGYFEGPGGEAGTLPIATQADAAAFDAYNVERMRAADTLLLGRTTYDLFRGFWPGVADDERASADQREIGRLQDTLAKVVVSDTLTTEGTTPWSEITRVVRRADAHARIRSLKDAPGRDLLAFGSRILWNDLLAADLVDELHLMVSPVVFGAGTPAFAHPGASLRLLGARGLESSELVLLTYAAGREPR
jgi:dihydrofolate reductase